MKKKEKAPVKFLEDRLYFQYFMLIFCLCPKSVIITTLIQEHFNVLPFSGNEYKLAKIHVACSIPV